MEHKVDQRRRMSEPRRTDCDEPGLMANRLRFRTGLPCGSTRRNRKRLAVRFHQQNLRSGIILDSRSENPIARITQSRQNIPLLIQLPVDGCTVDWNLWMLPMQRFDAFRGGDEADETHCWHAGFFQK